MWVNTKVLLFMLVSTALVPHIKSMCGENLGVPPWRLGLEIAMFPMFPFIHVEYSGVGISTWAGIRPHIGTQSHT